ncbi:hypothetical protein [Nonomuraea typhae]|uniref:Uncharacterized protein n=1 Tax=Nonomuraea typhae TaxID=2603600 RepID=A0ABW7Z666_9ACTN
MTPTVAAPRSTDISPASHVRGAEALLETGGIAPLSGVGWVLRNDAPMTGSGATWPDDPFAEAPGEEARLFGFSDVWTRD